MSAQFDSDAVAKLGWRQGAVLGTKLAGLAREYAPKSLTATESDWLIITSHDCDVVNWNIEKEPVVEVLRATIAQDKKPDGQQVLGRNPRKLQVAVNLDDRTIVLGCVVHERWSIPRELLVQEAPVHCLDRKHRRLIAEWLAKRYIRAAFPTGFDKRWRSKLRAWQQLLKKHSEWLQGVYLRLSTLDELADEEPYECHFILAVPARKRGGSGWAKQRELLERETQEFWKQFEPGIDCVDVDVFGTDELTLESIELHQRFDADWVSFADDTAVIPPTVDMSS